MEEDKTGSGNGADEKTTFTLDEVNQMKEDMKANYEKGIQKKFKQEKDLDKILDEVGKVADNKEHLIGLFEENEEVAKIILDKYYEGQSIEEYKANIGYKPDYTDEKTIEKLVDKRAKTIADTQKIETAKAEFIKKLKLEGDELHEFEEAFEERILLKSFKSKPIDFQLEKAFREISDDTEMLNKLKAQEVIGKTTSTGEGKGGGSSKSVQKNSTRDEAADFVNKFIN